MVLVGSVAVAGVAVDDQGMSGLDAAAAALYPDVCAGAEGLPEHDAGPRRTCPVAWRVRESYTPPLMGIAPWNETSGTNKMGKGYTIETRTYLLSCDFVQGIANMLHIYPVVDGAKSCYTCWKYVDFSSFGGIICSCVDVVV